MIQNGYVRIIVSGVTFFFVCVGVNHILHDTFDFSTPPTLVNSLVVTVLWTLFMLALMWRSERLKAKRAKEEKINKNENTLAIKNPYTRMIFGMPLIFLLFHGVDYSFYKYLDWYDAPATMKDSLIFTVLFTLLMLALIYNSERLKAKRMREN